MGIGRYRYCRVSADTLYQYRSNPSVINRLLYDLPCWYQLGRNCDHQNATTTKVVDDTASSSTSALSWTLTTEVDGQIFGSKAYESMNSQPVEKCNFYITKGIWRPCWGWSHRNFVEIFCIIKLESLGYLVALFSEILYLAVVADWLVTNWQTVKMDGRTDRRTRDDNKYRISIASRM